jgi:hypothetical protein
VPEDRFESLINEWTTENLKGKTVKSKKQAGFINNKLVYLEIEAVSEISFRDPYATK